MSKAFQITQPASGVIIGIYEADSVDGAILAAAQDAGYDSIEEQDEVTGDDARGTLDVRELRGPYELHNAFEELRAGSLGFVIHVETRCGFDDASRDELKRLSLAAESEAKASNNGDLPGEAFLGMWENEAWWTDEEGDDISIREAIAAAKRGDVDTLVTYVMQGVLENAAMNGPMESPVSGWEASDAMDVYLGDETMVEAEYHESGEVTETVVDIPDSVRDQIERRLEAWWQAPLTIADEAA